MKKNHFNYILLLFMMVAIMLNLVFFNPALAQQKPLHPQTGNEKKMVEILNDIGKKAVFNENAFLINDRGVEYYREKLKNPGKEDRLLINSNLANQLLLAGKTDEAIAEIEKILPEVKASANASQGPDHYTGLKNVLALAYLRKGEQVNCIINHNGESCIYPIGGKGVYAVKEYTRKAVSIYMEILKEHPEDLMSKWLLNLAHMTLGTYPDSVPSQWLVSSDTHDSEHKMGRFRDIAPALGLDVNDYAGSVIIEDFNNDGNLDVFMDAEGYSSKMHLFINKGDGKFEDRATQAGFDGMVAGRVAAQGDYNNDGHTDIYVCRGAWLSQEDNHIPNSLLMNRGDGSFQDVTIEAGLFARHPTSSAAWADYDRDGFLDLYVGNETGEPQNPHPCQLYHNNGDGTFTEVGAETFTAVYAFVKSVCWGDYNNDGWPDLYVSSLNSRNYLFMNKGRNPQGKVLFEEVAVSAGVNNPFHSFPSLFFDYNNDGNLDIIAMVHTGPFMNVADQVVSEYLKKTSSRDLHPCLYLNMGDGTFKNITEEAGLDRIIYAMSVAAGDIDNDGFMDLYAGTGFLDLRYLFPNVMLRNDGGRKFQDVTTVTGTGNIQKGHGIAFGDLDNDGDQDIISVLGGGFTTDSYSRVFFENPGNANRWLQITLEGVKSNRSAIGARIKVTIIDKKGLSRDIYTWVNTSSSFGSSCLRREIGLADAATIKSVEITWPSGTIQQFNKLMPDTEYRIKEGNPKAKTVKRKKINFEGTESKHGH